MGFLCCSLENDYDFLPWECLKAMWNFKSSLEGARDITQSMQL